MIKKHFVSIFVIVFLKIKREINSHRPPAMILTDISFKTMLLTRWFIGLRRGMERQGC